ncbi:helix-turn-helix domain-containing protein [Pseudomonas moorei]|uniref:Helix-turn-helix domain of resolvase n=1 Tax=Pseudomonas moorei TaxID=395599 RepID=A0A1H1FLE0_9PSED|nr:helix-turn-helix domain-containing protein [Pseudomonas moorei]SDR01700.1 Helix-turn-helix domain of resolvase [Pseudomonas moorei]
MSNHETLNGGPCSEEDCGKKAKTGGLCSMHYARKVRGGLRQPTLSPQSIGQIFTMNAAGHPASSIAKAVGCSYPTVVRYLNNAGIVLGNKGRKRELTDEYLNMALDMRAQGKKWDDIEAHIGFCRQTFQTWIRATRAQSC